MKLASYAREKGGLMNTKQYIEKNLLPNQEIFIFASDELSSLRMNPKSQKLIYRGQVKNIPLRVLELTRVETEYYNEAFEMPVLRVIKDYTIEFNDWGFAEAIDMNKKHLLSGGMTDGEYETAVLYDNL